MKFKLEIDCDNAAFVGDPVEEVVRILAEARRKLLDADIDEFIKLFDINGNAVGSMYFQDPERERA